ncbi:MAG: hypothetical protein ACK5KO_12060 [Arachnia sp.]
MSQAETPSAHPRKLSTAACPSIRLIRVSPWTIQPGRRSRDGRKVGVAKKGEPNEKEVQARALEQAMQPLGYRKADLLNALRPATINYTPDVLMKKVRGDAFRALRRTGSPVTGINIGHREVRLVTDKGALAIHQPDPDRPLKFSYTSFPQRVEAEAC